MSDEQESDLEAPATVMEGQGEPFVDDVGDKESSAAALARYCRQHEVVRDLGGDLYALVGDDAIVLPLLVDRAARWYLRRSGKVASAAVRKDVLLLIADPDAPERDLGEILEAKQLKITERLEEAAVKRLEREREAQAAELEEVETEAAPLLELPNLLPLFEATISPHLGGADTVRAAQALYLVLTSRLLPVSRCASEFIKGQSSVGKSHLAGTTLKFLPSSGIIHAQSMSSKALFYRAQGELVDLGGKVLYLGEAASSLEVDFTVAILRQLLSEGYATHETVIDGEWVALKVVGPVSALITTTRSAIDPEMETRFLSDWLDDSEHATREVMRVVANVESGRLAPLEVGSWGALQRLIELKGPFDVVNPLVDGLSEAMPAMALRARRDLTLISLLMKAHCLLHFNHRDLDDTGRLIVKDDDYLAVRRVAGKLFDHALGNAVPPRVRALVAQLPERGQDGISYREAGRRLRVDHKTAANHARAAMRDGFALNVSHTKAVLLTKGDEIPAEGTSVMPELDELRRVLSSIGAPQGSPPPQDGGNAHESLEKGGELPIEPSRAVPQPAAGSGEPGEDGSMGDSPENPSVQAANGGLGSVGRVPGGRDRKVSASAEELIAEIEVDS